MPRDEGMEIALSFIPSGKTPGAWQKDRRACADRINGLLAAKEREAESLRREIETLRQIQDCGSADRNCPVTQSTALGYTTCTRHLVNELQTKELVAICETERADALRREVESLRLEVEICRKAVQTARDHESLWKDKCLTLRREKEEAERKLNVQKEDARILARLTEEAKSRARKLEDNYMLSLNLRDALDERVQVLEEALRRAQYGGKRVFIPEHGSPPEGSYRCVACLRRRDVGCASDCWIAALLPECKEDSDA